MLLINQKKEGYRYSIDSFLIANFLRCSGSDKIIDLGTGCGIIPFLLYKKYPDITIYGIDIQEEFIKIAKENKSKNNFSDPRINFIVADILNLNQRFKPESFTIAITNPPYYRLGTGRINPQKEKATARHELSANLVDFLYMAFYLLKNGGKFFIIFPVDRFIELCVALRESKLEPKRIRFISSNNIKPPHLLMIEAKKNANCGLKMENTFFIYDGEGEYTDEVKEIYTRIKS